MLLLILWTLKHPLIIWYNYEYTLTHLLVVPLNHQLQLLPALLLQLISKRFHCHLVSLLQGEHLRTVLGVQLLCQAL